MRMKNGLCSIHTGWDFNRWTDPLWQSCCVLKITCSICIENISSPHKYSLKKIGHCRNVCFDEVLVCVEAREPQSSLCTEDSVTYCLYWKCSVQIRDQPWVSILMTSCGWLLTTTGYVGACCYKQYVHTCNCCIQSTLCPWGRLKHVFLRVL